MNWVFAHLYVSGIIVAGLLLLGGAFVVQQRSPVSSSGTSETWGGVGGFAYLGSNNTGGQRERISTQELLQNQQPSYEYVLPPLSTQTDEPTEDIDWEALLQTLTTPLAGGTEVGGETTGAYSFIPQGLVSASTASSPKTPKQQALYEYGNRIGQEIKSFDEQHANATSLLKNAYEDRGNTQKADAAAKTGQDLIELGKRLEEDIDSVPQDARAMHLALANAYRTAGEKYVAKLYTKTDDEFLAAINTYNASVDEVIKRQLALITLFEVAEIRFSASDPGSVFMFQQSGGF